MEASALQAPATLPETRVVMGAPLLRFRSDDQLLALFRAGHDEAFRVIHDRYHKRLFAYTRQMLPGRQDAEDALQDVFVRAYSGLRATDHELALRAWLFRVAHNRCIDELRRPVPPPPEVLQLVRTTSHDPLAEVDLRESLRRLIEDIRRLPEQQRSALLMRELVGMSYADLSASLGISVGAVKSLLVRARVALAQAAEARDTSCLIIREQLVESHDRGLRPNATARKHMRDCVGCKSFRRELRGMSRQLAAVTPAVGPLGILAKTLGLSGGAGGGAAGGGGLALLGGGGAGASAGGLAVGVNHLATLLVAAAATAGGAVEIQHTLIAPVHHSTHAPLVARHRHPITPASDSAGPAAGIQAIAGEVEATVSTAPKLAASADAPGAKPLKAKLRHNVTAGGAGLAPATGAPGVDSLSGTYSSTTGTGAAGLDDGSASSTAGACTSTEAATAGTQASTGTASTTAGAASAGTTTLATKTPVTPVTKGSVTTVPAAPCTPSTTPSDTASSSSTATGSSTSGAQSSGSSAGASSSTTTSSGASSNPPASGSASSSSSSSTGSGGGSASASK